MSKPKALPNIPALVLDGFSLDITHYVQKEYLDIGQASVELPAIIEWLNYQAQVNDEALRKREAELDRTEAGVYFKLKDGEHARLGYGDKPTEKSLEHAIALDEKVIELKDDIAVFKALVDRLRNLQRSLVSKLELVRSTEATRRKLVSE